MRACGDGGQGGSVPAILGIVLMIFFVQFLVMLTIMIRALWLARPEVPIQGREPGHGPSPINSKEKPTDRTALSVATPAHITRSYIP